MSDECRCPFCETARRDPGRAHSMLMWLESQVVKAIPSEAEPTEDQVGPDLAECLGHLNNRSCALEPLSSRSHKYRVVSFLTGKVEMVADGARDALVTWYNDELDLGDACEHPLGCSLSTHRVDQGLCPTCARKIRIRKRRDSYGPTDPPKPKPRKKPCSSARS